MMLINPRSSKFNLTSQLIRGAGVGAALLVVAAFAAGSMGWHLRSVWPNRGAKAAAAKRLPQPLDYMDLCRMAGL